MVLEICSLAEPPGLCSLVEFNWHPETRHSSGGSCLEQGGHITSLGCLKGRFIPQEKVACVDAAGSLRCVNLPLPGTGDEATTAGSARGAAGVGSSAGLLVWKGSLELGLCCQRYSVGELFHQIVEKYIKSRGNGMAFLISLMVSATRWLQTRGCLCVPFLLEQTLRCWSAEVSLCLDCVLSCISYVSVNKSYLLRVIAAL